MREAAPIVELADDPTPDGLQAFWFTAKDGTRLRAVICPAKPKTTAKGSILFSPGRTEYIEKYFEFIGEMTARGFCVAVIDHRGQGLSDRSLSNRLLGHVKDFSLYASDLETLWEQIMEQMPGPLFLLAHSMGGAIAADVVRRGKLPVQKLAASAPMLGFAGAGGFLRGAIRLFFALGIRNWSPPGLSGGGALDPESAKVLTSDPDRFDRDIRRNTKEPKLQLAGPTVGWLYAALHKLAQMEKNEGYRDIEIPVFFTSAGREALISNEAIETACRQMPNARCEQSEDALHEIFQERDALRSPFIEALARFLES